MILTDYVTCEIICPFDAKIRVLFTKYIVIYGHFHVKGTLALSHTRSKLRIGRVYGIFIKDGMKYGCFSFIRLLFLLNLN